MARDSIQTNSSLELKKLPLSVPFLTKSGPVPTREQEAVCECVKSSNGIPRIQSGLIAKYANWLYMAVAASFILTACDFSTGQLEATLCSKGIAVTNPTQNAGLVEDCAALHGLRDRLAGQVSLNWSAQRPMNNWEGVGIDTDSTPLRVTEIRLDGRDLTGVVPSALGSLYDLRSLLLGDNRLTGEIPASLSAMSSLRELGLGMDDLSGTVPEELGEIYNLRTLRLAGNFLGGCLP